MSKINIDEQAQLSEPIEVTLEGNDYVVSKVTTGLLSKVTELGKSRELDVPIKELALLLGVDAGEFEGVDLRKVSRALEFIMGEINKGINSPKNSPGVATP